MFYRILKGGLSIISSCPNGELFYSLKEAQILIEVGGAFRFQSDILETGGMETAAVTG